MVASARHLLRFWPDVRPHVPALLVVAVLSGVGPFLEAAGIWVFKRIVDDVLVPLSPAALPPLAGLLVAITLADAALTFAESLLSAWTGERFLLSLRTRIYAHLLASPIHVIERRRVGDLLARLNGDAGALEGFLLGAVSKALADVLRIVFFVAALLLLDWLLALAALVAAPLLWLAARRLSTRIHEVSREVASRAGSSTAVAEETLSAAAVIQAYAREDVEVERFAREAQLAMGARLAANRLRASLSPVIDVVELAAGLTVLALGTWALTAGRLTLGGLLVFITYVGKLYSPVRGLGSFFGTRLPAALAGAERIIELLDEPPAPSREDGAVLTAPRGVVEFERVSYRYPDSSSNALEQVSFRVGPGETLAVVGASGAGKSTIAKLLLGLCEPTSGRILLDGRDLRELSVRSVRAAIAYVPQEAWLSHASIRENVEFGRPEATELEIRAAVREADADEFIAELPERYETVVAQRGRRLSGGQRQRIALARALVRRAPVMLLDEPTTGLDGATSARIMDWARIRRAGVTTIVISHDPDAVSGASEVLVLARGRVVDRGPPAELAERSPEFADVYRERDLAAGAPP